MRIAYATTYDPRDVRSWSGTGYYIMNMLQAEGFSLELLPNLTVMSSVFDSARQAVSYQLTGRRFIRARTTRVARGYASQIERRIDPRTRLLFCPGSLPIAFVKDGRPKVFYTDATFAGMLEFYPSCSDYCDDTIRAGHEVEAAAIESSALAIYSSEWAAESAIKYYGASPAKVRVIPFGANLGEDMLPDDVIDSIDRKRFDECHLLFCGVDWVRKGGGTALQVARLLNDRGLSTVLHIVGIPELLKEARSPIVKNHGFLSKAVDRDRKELDKLYSMCHFLLLPTIADASPVVLCEACAYGLPPVTTNVGGISSIVADGVSGRTFSPTAAPAEYADYIERMFGDRTRYRELAVNARDAYEKRLNWKVTGREVGKCLRSLM